MGNPAKHSKLRIFVQSKSFTHPGEKVSQTEVPASDAFWNPRASAREGQCTNTVWAENNIGIRAPQFGVSIQDIVALQIKSTGNFTIR